MVDRIANVNEEKERIVKAVRSVGTKSICTLCQKKGLILDVVFKAFFAIDDDGREFIDGIVVIKRCECYLSKLLKKGPK